LKACLPLHHQSVIVKMDSLLYLPAADTWGERATTAKKLHGLRPLLREMQWISESEHALCSTQRITICLSNFVRLSIYFLINSFIYHAHWINHLFWGLNQKNNIPIRLFPDTESLTTWPKRQVIHDVFIYGLTSPHLELW
jgi:hypothetical protein